MPTTQTRLRDSWRLMSKPLRINPTLLLDQDPNISFHPLQMARKPRSRYHLLLFSFTILSFLSQASPLSANMEWKDEKEDEISATEQSHHASLHDCDFSVGEWVFYASYPLYNSGCPYLSTQVSCLRNGRPDTDYEKWRWKSRLCSISKFNALDFLERIRGKRVVLVGDSIVRNQWESLVCLVEAVIPSERKMVSHHGPSIAFHALDFEVSIEPGIIPSSWDLYEEEGKLFTDLNPMVAYEKGLTTWAKWVDLNLDPRRSRIIFRTVSPRHNRENGLQSYKQREPLVFLGYSPREPAQVVVLREVLKRMSGWSSNLRLQPLVLARSSGFMECGVVCSFMVAQPSPWK